LFVESLPVFDVLLRHDCVLRVRRFSAAHQSLDREQGSSDRERWAPLVFQNIQANSSGDRTDVRMPNFGVEFHLGVRAASSAYFRGGVWVVVINLDVDAELSLAVG